MLRCAVSSSQPAYSVINGNKILIYRCYIKRDCAGKIKGDYSVKTREILLNATHRDGLSVHRKMIWRRERAKNIHLIMYWYFGESYHLTRSISLLS